MIKLIKPLYLILDSIIIHKLGLIVHNTSIHCIILFLTHHFYKKSKNHREYMASHLTSSQLASWDLMFLTPITDQSTIRLNVYLWHLRLTGVHKFQGFTSTHPPCTYKLWRHYDNTTLAYALRLIPHPLRFVSTKCLDTTWRDFRDVTM